MATPSTDGLEAKRVEIENRIASLRAMPSDQVATALREADAVVAAYKDDLAAAEAELASIDGELQFRARNARQAAAQQREAEETAMRRQLVVGKEKLLAHLARADEHLRAYVAEISAAGVEHSALRHAAKTLLVAVTGSPSATLPAGFNAGAFVGRISGGLISLLRTVRIAGAHNSTAHWFGEIGLPSRHQYPDDETAADRENRAVSPAVDELLNKGKEL